jgi:hypothetical protein
LSAAPSKRQTPARFANAKFYSWKPSLNRGLLWGSACDCVHSAETENYVKWEKVQPGDRPILTGCVAKVAQKRRFRGGFSPNLSVFFD